MDTEHDIGLLSGLLASMLVTCYFLWRIWHLVGPLKHVRRQSSGVAGGVSNAASRPSSGKTAAVAGAPAAGVAGAAAGAGGVDGGTSPPSPGFMIDYSEVTLGDQVPGSESMGKLYQGQWRGLQVAVRVSPFDAGLEALRREAVSIVKVRHPALVLFLGLAMPDEGTVAIVNEWLPEGSLWSVLGSSKHQTLSWQTRVDMALDTARAVSYLHGFKPPLLHKFLHSTNILCDTDLHCRVSDYALSFFREQVTGRRSLQAAKPHWTAPEVLRKGKYSKYSDVYSFGIVLWELMARRAPYAEDDNDDAVNGDGHTPTYPNKDSSSGLKRIQQVIKGKRPVIPSYTPEPMVKLIESCWASDPSSRPSFNDIVTALIRMMPMTVDTTSWYTPPMTFEEKQAAQMEQMSTALSNYMVTNRQQWMVPWSEITIEQTISKGSFGSVVTGKFRGQLVAIKRLHAQDMKMTTFNSFMQELSMMSRIKHDNIVLFMGACLEANHLCLLLEYCEKGTLYDILHDPKQHFDYNQIVKACTETAQAINYLHHCDPPIFHRDLKSLNILVDGAWNIKLADFGLTVLKETTPPTSTEAVETAALLPAITHVEQNQEQQQGTLIWSAPEVLKNGSYTEKSDVYSFSLVCFETLTRKLPFADMSPHQAALAVLSDNLRPEIPAFAPPRFRAMIEESWDRDPAKRPTMPALLKTLALIKEEGLPRLELTLDNAQIYEKKLHVYAFPSKDSVIVYKPWGIGEGKKGDYVVVGPGEDVYTCDRDIFLRTYEPVDETIHCYRKKGTILAREMPDAFMLETMEGVESGAAGDYLAQNPIDNEQWPIYRSSFQKMYSLAEVQELPKPTADALAPLMIGDAAPPGADSPSSGSAPTLQNNDSYVSNNSVSQDGGEGDGGGSIGGGNSVGRLDNAERRSVSMRGHHSQSPSTRGKHDSSWSASSSHRQRGSMSSRRASDTSVSETLQQLSASSTSAMQQAQVQQQQEQGGPQRSEQELAFDNTIRKLREDKVLIDIDEPLPSMSRQQTFQAGDEDTSNSKEEDHAATGL